MEKIKEKHTGLILIASLFLLLPIFFSNIADGYYYGGSYYSGDPYEYIPQTVPAPLPEEEAPEAAPAETAPPTFVDVAEDDPIMSAVKAAALRNGIDPDNVQVAHFSDLNAAKQYSDDLKALISQISEFPDSGIKPESVPDFTEEDIVLTNEIKEPHAATDTNPAYTVTTETFTVLRDINNDGSLEPVYMRKKETTTVEPTEAGQEPTVSKLLEEYSLFNEDSYNGTSGTREGQFFDITQDAGGLVIFTSEIRRDVIVEKNGEEIWGLESMIGVRWFDTERNNITAAEVKDSTGTVASVDMFYDPVTGDQISYHLYDADGNLLNPAAANPANPAAQRNPRDPGTSPDPGTPPNNTSLIANQVKKQLQEFSVLARINTVKDWAEEAVEEYRAIDEAYLADNRLGILKNQGSKLSSYGLSEDHINGYRLALDNGGEAVARAYLASLGLLTDEQLSGVFNITIADGQSYFLSLYSEEIANIAEMPLEDFLTNIMEFSEWTVKYIMHADLGMTNEVMAVIIPAANEMEFDKALESIAGDNLEELQEQAILMIKEAVLNGLITPPLSIDDVDDVIDDVIEVLDLILQDLGAN
ncbi:MAG: hypothetical protein P9L98_04260 [Candidatus Kaelpia imicola]|nr:hypothetical protein [Candidatus Kaelpia imicola]